MQLNIVILPRNVQQWLIGLATKALGILVHWLNRIQTTNSVSISKVSLDIEKILKLQCFSLEISISQ